MLQLKSGFNLLQFSGCSSTEEEQLVPELAERMALERFALLWNVDPQATLSTDGARTFDDESQHISLVTRRWEVNVPTGHIGGAVILQWEQVDLARGAHCDQARIGWVDCGG